MAADIRLGPVADALQPPPRGFAGDVETYLQALASTGRGDNARGRNFHALNVLEWSARWGWIRYRPTRDPVRWIVMLADLVGAYAGLTPRARVELSFGEFLGLVGRSGLPRLAMLTRRVACEEVARRVGRGATARRPSDRAGEICRSEVAPLLWHLGYDARGYRNQVHFEKHSQGRLIRQKIADGLDGAWADALQAQAERRGRVDAALLLAGFAPSFARCSEIVDGVLARVGDSLASSPFAVFYALATDAARGGRVWEPPAAMVEGGAYTRADFRAAVDRRARSNGEQRDTALAELGLSSSFPRTVAVMDAWLASGAVPELHVDAPAFGAGAWQAVAGRATVEIGRIHGAMVRTVDRRLRA